MTTSVMSNRSTNLGSKSPTGGPVRKKVKQLPEKKIAEDEFMAAAIGDVEWLKQSLKGNRGQINFDKNGLAPIHLAAIHGRLECLKHLVEKCKVDVNLASSTGWRPIHCCISNQTGKRAFQSLLYLLEKGADPSIRNDDKITPAHQAASEGHVQCLKALIEVGADITSLDDRGHRPIDLAKLWGHRKCARILAAESWHQSKEFLATEMKQLQKVQMQKALAEIAADESEKADQQFYGDIAFQQWMENRGKDSKASKSKEKSENKPESGRKGKTPVEKGTIQKGGAPTASTQKNESGPKIKSTPQQNTTYQANSYRQPLAPLKKVPSPIREEESPSPNRRVQEASRESVEGYRSPYTKSSNGSAFYDREEPADQQKEMNENAAPQVEYMPPPTWMRLHPADWNFSTKVPPKEYITDLTDEYPRDEYTMKPMYQLKKKSAKKNNVQGLKEEMSKPGSALSGVRMPQLPADVINKKLDPSKYERPVVYKCKHIADVHKKHIYDFEDLPRHEAGLHLTGDTSSILFRNGLLIDPTPGTPSTAISGVSGWSDDTAGGVNLLMGRMGRNRPYPNIQGHSYDIINKQVPA